MCATYGADSCQLLKIGEGSADGLPNVWQKLDFFDKLLENGLVRALQHAQQGHQNERKDSIPSSVSTIIPTYKMIQPVSFPVRENIGSPTGVPKLISESDRQACKAVVEAFLRNSLIPHAERLMRTLNDQLADRRTIGKSLTSGMKKWFGGTAQNTIAAPVSYSSESNEMKSRRLADIAHQFGLYAFAHSQYRAVKKDFENDQVWLYHAAALEMSAVALKLSAPELTAKQFPVRYLEDAIKHMLANAAKYTSIMKCAINAGRILSELEQPKEAAVLLSQISTLDNDHCVGVAQVYAAKYFQDAGQERKSAFYYVLAGNRFMKGGIQSIALECYRLALGHYFEKQWDNIEDHLCSIIAQQSVDKQLAIDCASRLLRATLWQTEMEQNRFVDNFTQTLERFGEGRADSPMELPIPKICAQETTVICGERPLSDDIIVETTEVDTIRRGAFHAVAGSSSSFRESSLQLVSNDNTNNKEFRETPADERFRVIVTLKNPLTTVLRLRQLHLIVGDYSYADPSSQNNTPFTFSTVEEMELGPKEKKEVELSVLPATNIKHFRISAISLKIVDSKGHEIFGKLSLSTRGKRLCRNPKEMKTAIYAEDNRLAAKVSKQKWPLLDIKAQKPQAVHFYGSQAVKIKVEANNIGFEAVENLVLATDGFDCIHVTGNVNDDYNCSSASAVNANTVRIHNLTKNIPVGSRHSFMVNIRAPQVETVKSVALLFFYRGVSGSYREWRLVVNIPTISLIQASAKVLDPMNGLVHLNLANVIPKLDAEIAELDVLKIQSVCHKLSTTGDFYCVPSGLQLQPVTTKPLHLDNGQSAEICFTMRGTSSEEENLDRFWLHEKIDYPHWSLPYPTDKNFPAAERMISILWRSSIVDQGGFKSIIMGEVFVPCPFKEASLLIPGTISSDFNDGEENCPLSIRCPSLDIFNHDFNSHRLFEFPLKFHIYNQDVAKRSMLVTISFNPKVIEPVEAVSQVAPESRQLWWPDRLVTRANIEAGQEHTFKFHIRVTQPSVYDIGGSYFRIDGQFLDSKKAITLQVPSTLIVVNSI